MEQIVKIRSVCSVNCRIAQRQHLNKYVNKGGGSLAREYELLEKRIIAALNRLTLDLWNYRKVINSIL